MRFKDHFSMIQWFKCFTIKKPYNFQQLDGQQMVLKTNDFCSMGTLGNEEKYLNWVAYHQIYGDSIHMLYTKKITPAYEISHDIYPEIE